MRSRTATARPRGARSEIADLLSFIKHAAYQNVVWLTADMHYTAAHHYDPEPRGVPGFRAVLGIRLRPAACRHLGPGAARQHLWAAGALFQKGCTAEQGENLAPCFGLQFFGRVDIDGRRGSMTVTLKDVGDKDLWSVRIEPEQRVAVKFAERR